ncbi:MAG TPA: hemerythrin domain-containing protein [Candidatus Limnocylindrales bacterium]|nr:hemerythrin domain-containing protein [Candidatus Limnocylindrales bacterium]
MAKRHDALIPLSHDHQKALMLAFRLLHPSPPGPETPTTPASTPQQRREEVLAFFETHLVEHFAIEEEILFPVLRASGVGLEPLVDELCEDHRRMRSARDRVAQAGDEAQLCRALEDFGQLLEAHVRREEREMFAGFPGALPGDDVRELHERIHARRPPDEPWRRRNAPISVRRRIS